MNNNILQHIKLLYNINKTYTGANLKDYYKSIFDTLVIQCPNNQPFINEQLFELEQQVLFGYPINIRCSFALDISYWYNELNIRGLDNDKNPFYYLIPYISESIDYKGSSMWFTKDKEIYHYNIEFSLILINETTIQ